MNGASKTCGASETRLADSCPNSVIPLDELGDQDG